MSSIPKTAPTSANPPPSPDAEKPDKPIFMAISAILTLGSFGACVATYFYGDLGNFHTCIEIPIPKSLLFLTGLMPAALCFYLADPRYDLADPMKVPAEVAKPETDSAVQPLTATPEPPPPAALSRAPDSSSTSSNST